MAKHHCTTDVLQIDKPILQALQSLIQHAAGRPLLSLQVTLASGIKIIAEIQHDVLWEQPEASEKVEEEDDDSGEEDKPSVNPSSSSAGSRESLGCLRELRTILRVANRRLTTKQILVEATRRNLPWSESTVKYTLAVAVDLGELTNDREANPRGYGMPEWE